MANDRFSKRTACSCPNTNNDWILRRRTDPYPQKPQDRFTLAHHLNGGNINHRFILYEGDRIIGEAHPRIIV